MWPLFIQILTSKPKKLSLILWVLKSSEIPSLTICSSELIVWSATTVVSSTHKQPSNNWMNSLTCYKFPSVQVQSTEVQTLSEQVWSLTIGLPSVDLNPQPLKFKLFKVFSSSRATIKWNKKTEKVKIRKCVFFEFYIFLSKQIF